MAVLAPSLRQAKDIALLTMCLNNQRHTMVAVQTYGSVFRGRTPSRNEHTDTLGRQPWYHFLRAYPSGPLGNGEGEDSCGRSFYRDQEDPGCAHNLALLRNASLLETAEMLYCTVGRGPYDWDNHRDPWGSDLARETKRGMSWPLGYGYHPAVGVMLGFTYNPHAVESSDGTWKRRYNRVDEFAPDAIVLTFPIDFAARHHVFHEIIGPKANLAFIDGHAETRDSAEAVTFINSGGGSAAWRDFEANEKFLNILERAE